MQKQLFRTYQSSKKDFTLNLSDSESRSGAVAIQAQVGQWKSRPKLGSRNQGPNWAVESTIITITFLFPKIPFFLPSFSIKELAEVGGSGSGNLVLGPSSMSSGSPSLPPPAEELALELALFFNLAGINFVKLAVELCLLALFLTVLFWAS